jgi:hypothetical protein
MENTIIFVLLTLAACKFALDQILHGHIKMRILRKCTDLQLEPEITLVMGKDVFSNRLEEGNALKFLTHFDFDLVDGKEQFVEHLRYLAIQTQDT